MVYIREKRKMLVKPFLQRQREISLSPGRSVSTVPGSTAVKRLRQYFRFNLYDLFTMQLKHEQGWIT